MYRVHTLLYSTLLYTTLLYYSTLPHSISVENDVPAEATVGCYLVHYSAVFDTVIQYTMVEYLIQ